MINTITSKDNKILKEVRSLLQKKNREKLGKYLIEGQRIVEQAIEVSYPLEKVIFQEDVLLKNEELKNLSNKLDANGIQVISIDEKLFKDISQVENSQGIIAVANIVEDEKTEDIINENFSFGVVLDKIQDPGNLGTILRTAEALGADFLFLLKGCVDLYNPKTVRSTMGSIFTMKVYSGTHEELLEVKEAGKYKLVSADLKGAKFSNQIEKYENKTMLVIGNEGNGISKEVLEMSDIRVKIPLLGRAESLNASMAAGILIYDIKQKIKS